jgi:predicted outer membrane repeat protein
MKKQPVLGRKVLRWVLAGLFLVLGNFSWSSGLQASGVVGTGTPASCTQTALTTALIGGGLVTFNCGGPATILVTSPITVTQNTVIEGGGQIKITGGLTTRLFDVTALSASLTLNNIVLDSANSAGGGGGDGGALKSVGTLVLNNVTIQFSQTPGCGGAIWSNGTMIISDSTFNNNTGVGAGGAICTGQAGTTHLQVTNSSFSSNQTTSTTSGYGGAIYVAGPVAEVTIVDSSFLNNSAHLGGGLFVFTGGTATLRTQNPAKKVLFLGNSATEDGGAIYNLGTLSIYQAELNANQTPQGQLGIGYGGGIHNQGNLTLHDSLLSVNLGRFGGGLFVGNANNAQAEVQRTIFSGNSAGATTPFLGGSGGGLYTNTGATVTVTDSVFRNNTAVASGGGASRFNAHLEISNSSFTDNQATDVTGGGGGLFIGAGPATDPTLVKVTSVTFGGNKTGSSQGGGIYNNSGYILLKNLTIKDNINGLFNTGTFTTHLGNSVLDNPGSLNCDGNGLPLSLDGNNLSTDNSCLVEHYPVPAQLGLRVINTNGINQTRYFPPLAGSPLINATTGCPTLDQRGASRPNACDIGAVEYGGIAWHIYSPLIEKH